MKRLILLSLLFLSLPAAAEVATTADKLPLSSLPHYRPLVSKPEPNIEPGGSCAVRQDEVPPEFLTLLSKLDVPVTNTETGEVPLNDDIIPSSTLPQSRPALKSSGNQQTVHGVTIIQGNRSAKSDGSSHENGVTVYRGSSR